MSCPKIWFTKSQNSLNLPEYKQLYDDFIWQVDPNDNLNIANQAVDKDLNTVIENKVALRWLSKNDQKINLSYRDLVKQTTDLQVC